MARRTRTSHPPNKKRQEAFRRLWEDPRYIRIQKAKDAALKRWSHAEDTFRVTHRIVDKENADKADRSLRRILRALQKYEDAYLKRFG